MPIDRLAALPNSEKSRLIDEWITNERDREMIKRCLIDGARYKDLYDTVYLSDRQMRRIVSNGQTKILSKIKNSKSA